jgi:hypothetical protein
VICLEIVDLLLEEQCPEVFAEEFDDIEGCCGAWSVARESM